MKRMINYPQECDFLVMMYLLADLKDGCKAIVMEMADNSLMGEIEKALPVLPENINLYKPPAGAKKWLWEVYLGLRFLHIANILHRDLKPGNILVVDDEAKLADFGGSKCFSDESGKFKAQSLH